jgi:hypothetical protein
VNFFAHAYLAHERSADAAFVLGAMLPDLCAFSGGRLPEAPDSPLGDGVRFHHASDAAFHAASEFAAFCSELSAALQAEGVRRGPARGVAHVGGELLLDGWLARRRGVPALYRSALADARALLAGAPALAPLREGIAATCARVLAAPLPEAYTDAEFVCARVERALAPRAYLALAAHELPAVARALTEAAPLTERWAEPALASAAEGLAQTSARRPRPASAHA